MKDAKGQRDFGQLRAAERARPATAAQRGLAARAARSLADRVASPEDGARADALAIVEGNFAGFLRLVGVGGEFQVNDFVVWLDQTGLAPDRSDFDLRAMGGVVRRAKVRGLVASAGLAMTSGCASRNSNSCPRAVWRVVRLPEGAPA